MRHRSGKVRQPKTDVLTTERRHQPTNNGDYKQQKTIYAAVTDRTSTAWVAFHERRSSDVIPHLTGCHHEQHGLQTSNKLEMSEQALMSQPQ